MNPAPALDAEGREPGTGLSAGDDPGARALPRLAFGEAGARIESDLQAFTDVMANTGGSLQIHETLGGAKAFRQKSASINLDGLKLSAGACTPVRLKVGAASNLTLVIPFAGSINATVAGSTERLHAGAASGASARGLFLPAVPRTAEIVSDSSLLLIDLQPERLRTVARSMIGLEPDAQVELRLGQERAVDLRSGGVDFRAVLGHLCGLIDAYQGQPDLLRNLSLDDQFYRHALMLLRPGLAGDAVQRQPAPARAQRVLDPLCDHIMAHLHAPLSMSDLEQASGLSSRSLQYAFWQRHQCTPMQWVRGQRLEKVRALLLTREPVESVTSAALQWGFVNLGEFSAYYRERFGELPSETMRRKRKRS